MIESILIPKERIGVVKSKKNKDMLEKKLNVKLDVVDNLVEIEGEGLDLYIAKNVIKAIGRGFSPERALKLLEEDTYLEIIELGDFSENRARIIRSRVIGTKGKMREAIENSTGVYVSVYGKTISIIGKYDQIRNAKEAINMLISGARHETVYKFLNKLKI